MINKLDHHELLFPLVAINVAPMYLNAPRLPILDKGDPVFADVLIHVILPSPDMYASVVNLPTIVVGLDSVDDSLVIPMHEDPEGQSGRIKKTKAGHMSAPVETKLSSPEVPGFMAHVHRLQRSSEIPIGPM